MRYPARVNAEIAAYDSYIRARLETAIACVDGLNDAQLNWRPSIEGANSADVLAAHTLGAARAWVLGIVCGQPGGRDRPAEFAAGREGAIQLRRDLEALTREIASAFAALDPARLEQRFVPAQELWGENQTREISVREAMLRAIGHASIHVGHLEMTRDLALQQA